MRAVVWLTESSWEAAVDAAAAFAPGAEIVLLHVTPSDVEGAARAAYTGLLGRGAAARAGGDADPPAGQGRTRGGGRRRGCRPAGRGPGRRRRAGAGQPRGAGAVRGGPRAVAGAAGLVAQLRWLVSFTSRTVAVP